MTSLVDILLWFFSSLDFVAPIIVSLTFRRWQYVYRCWSNEPVRRDFEWQWKIHLSTVYFVERKLCNIVSAAALPVGVEFSRPKSTSGTLHPIRSNSLTLSPSSSVGCSNFQECTKRIAYQAIRTSWANAKHTQFERMSRKKATAFTRCPFFSCMKYVHCTVRRTVLPFYEMKTWQ